MSRIMVVIGIAVVALVVAACGGSSGGAYGGSTASKPTSGKGSVALASTKLGKVLVDGKGRTLYLFEADGPAKSACDGGCAAAWPPYVGGTPQAGTGVTGALLGTTARDDGGTQVTYAGHPLYYYAGDRAPGDAAGQGLDQFGAKWYVLGTDGAEIDKS